MFGIALVIVAASSLLVENSPPPTPAPAWQAAATEAATPTIVPAPPTPTPPPDASIAAVLGVTARGETYDPAVRALMTQAGVRWVRASVNWDAVEPSPGVFNWTSFDGHISILAGMGVIPVVYVAGNPAWAASSRCGPIDKVPLSEFARFVSTLAQRYNGRTVVNERTLPMVTYWQFYNEPDNAWTSGVASEFDGCWGRAGAEYAQMLAAAWTAVHTANPDALVVFGGISGEDVACPTSWQCAGQRVFNFDINGADFIDNVLEYMQNHPGSRYFDIFDFHYYPSFHARWDDYGVGLIGKTEYYRKRLALWGVERPIMCSEAGRRSDRGQVIDGVPGSDDEQGRRLVQLFAQGAHAGLVNVLWFTLSDIVDPKQGGAAGWGLLTQKLQPKPSHTAYSTLHKELSGLLYQGQAEVADEAALEGYVFAAAGRETTVIWARSGSVRTGFKAGQLKIVDLRGRTTTALDGGNGDNDRRADGIVTITVTQNPIFVERQP